VVDTNLGNNSASASAPIVAKADVKLTKTGPATSSAGNDVTYTLTVTNLGPSDATGVVATDPIPTGLTLVTPLSGTCGSGPGCTLAPGASQVMTVTFHIPPAYTTPDPIVNTASVTSTTTDPAALNNNAVSATALGAPVTDLSITKTNGTTSVTAGSPTTYTIVVTNAGPAAVANVSVQDTFDPGVFTNVQWRCVPSGGSICHSSRPQTGDISGALIDIGVGPGQAVTFTATATVLGTALGSAVNTATVTPPAAAADPDSSNNSATDTDTILSNADIAVTNVGPGTIVPGATATYTVTVTNNGPSPVTNQPVTFRLSDASGGDQPDWILSAAAPPGVTCQKVHYTGPSGDILLPVCTIATLASGANVSIMVSVKVPSSYSAPLPATITAVAFASPTSIPDPNPPNNSQTVVSNLAISADVSITKTGQTSMLAGNTRSFFLHVANAGPSDATSVVISDPTPAGVTVVGIDGGAACPSLPCTLPGLAAGENKDIRVDILVPAAFAGSSFLNTATVSAATSDLDSSNNTSSLNTVVVPVQTDLALTKTGAGSAAAGGTIEYDLAYENKGVAIATNAVLTDALPAGTTFSAITVPPGTTCQTPAVGATGIVRCVTLTVNPTDVVAVHLTLQANPLLAIGTVLTNFAAVSSDVPDFRTANDYAVANTVIAAATDADVSITNDDAPDPVLVGSDVTFTLTVHNTGPASATSVSVTDTLPAGLTLVSAIPSVGSCGSAVCSLGTLGAGASATITVVATATASGIFTTTATVSATEHDPAPGSNTAIQTTAAGTSSETDLMVEKIGAAVAEPGQVTGYILRVTNRGPGTAFNVQLSDPLPPEVTFESVVGACTSVTGSVCDLEMLLPGESRLVTVVVGVAAVSMPATATNTATVTTTTTDLDSSNDSATVVTDILASGSADVTVVKVDSTDPVPAGTPLNYVLLVTNRGPEAATGVQVSDPLAAGVTLVSATTPQGTCSGTTTVTCSLGTIGAGKDVVIVLAVEAPTSVPAPNPMINTATVTSGADPVPANNSGTAATTVLGPVADLQITKTATAPTVTAGTPIGWTIVVANAGPSHVVGATVTDALPLMPLGTSWTCAPSAGSACGALAGMGPIATAVDLPPGGTVTLFVTGTVPPSTAGILTNVAVVVPPPGLTDPNPVNNVAIAATTVESSADVRISKTGPASVFARGLIAYTLTVSNSGPSSATGVSVADPTAAGLTFLATAGDCSTAFPCALGTLLPGETRTITALYTVQPTAPASIANTATVSSGVPDPIAADNTSTVQTVVVTPQADLVLTKTGPSSVARGGTLNYTIVAHNAGPIAVTDVDVTDAVPGGMTFVSVAAPPLTTCTTPAVGAAGLVTCRTPLLLPGGDVGIRLVTQANMDLPIGTALVNAAMVSSSVADLNVENNRAQVQTVVAAATDADLAVAVVDAPDPVLAGGAVMYGVTVTNQGPADAAGVSLTATLPAGLALVSVDSMQGSCAGLTCTLGTLPSGAGATITITAIATAPGVYTVSAVASTTTHDPVLANNAAAEETTAETAGQADIAVELAGPATLAPGQAGVYQTHVSNRGLAAAAGVALTLNLPTGLVFAANTGDCTTGFACALGTLAPGETRTVLTTVTVDPGAVPTGRGPKIAAAVAPTATAVSVTPDANPANNSATVSTAVFAAGSADLQIVKTGSPTSVVAGTSLTYALIVNNRGPATAVAVSVNDTVPAGVTVLSVVSSAGSCSGTSSIACSLGDMAPGTSAVIEILADSPTSTPSPNPMINSATVSSASTDPVPASNIGVALTTIATSVTDLAVTKAASVTRADAGSSFNWTIVVTNNGPSDAIGASVTDVLPAGVGAATWTCTATAGSVCHDPSGSGSIVTTVDLRLAGSVTFVLTTTVAGSALGTLSNTVTVAPPAGFLDLDATNNTATGTVAIDPVVDLSVVKRGPARTPPGGTIAYTLTVRNAGPSIADVVRVADPTPDGLTFLSNSGDCTTAFPCALGAVPAGGTRSIVATYRVAGAATVPARIINVATVSSIGVARELQPVNDVGVAATAIVRGTRCDIDGDGIDDLVIGAGPGGGPHVRVFSVAGGRLTERAGFFAYDPAFTGGVFVACGDLDGDGRAEIVTGPGPGGDPEVRVFELVGSTVVHVASFHAYGPSFHGGVHVAVGDIDGDGRGEMITGPGPGGGPHVRAFSLAGSAATLRAEFLAYDPLFAGGVYVASGDVDGDGVDEIVTGAGPGGGPHVRIFSLTGATFTERGGFFAYAPVFAGGVSVAAGDLDGDGRAEVITGAGPGGGPHVRAFSFNGGAIAEYVGFLAEAASFTGGVDVAAGDLDGDGIAEIITGAGPGDAPRVRVLRAIGGVVSEVLNFLGYDPHFGGGVHVASAGSVDRRRPRVTAVGAATPDDPAQAGDALVRTSVPAARRPPGQRGSVPRDALDEWGGRLDARVARDERPAGSMSLRKNVEDGRGG
jgi:uncharacterized repeat protein (TIGR01451 family)